MIVQYKQINFTRATLLNAHNTLHLEKSDGGDDVEEGDERVDHQLSSQVIHSVWFNMKKCNLIE